MDLQFFQEVSLDFYTLVGIVGSTLSLGSAYPSGDLLNRFNNDVGTIVANAINWIPNLIVNVYMFVITFIVLFRMDIGMVAFGPPCS